MNVVKLRATPNENPAGITAGISAHRWVFDVAFGCASWLQQYKLDDKWFTGGSYFNVSLTRHWMWGHGHAYYDGPNCSFSIGFLHVNWSYNWCERCAGTS